MPCRLLHAAVFLMILPVFTPRFALAQSDYDDGVVVQPPAASDVLAAPAVVPPAATAVVPVPAPVPAPAAVAPVVTQSGAPIPAGSGYATLDAPLYPVPKPGIPLQVGATIITNPALYPHEMLYPHKYRALYPPFYRKTQRFWVLTPLGVYKRERVCLTGTEVVVKYKPYHGPFTLFAPPATGFCGPCSGWSWPGWSCCVLGDYP